MKKLLIFVLLGLLPRNAATQSAPDLFRITEGVSRNHMEYHQLQVPKGQDRVLADFKGPGKVTYFYITDDYTSAAFWYQEEPHQGFTLPSLKERTATSNTGEKK